jgi:hypothetical protein
MRRGWILVIALLCLTIPQLIPLADAAEDTYEPGFTEWKVNDVNRIYLSGPDGDANLTRDYQGKAEGAITLNAGQTIQRGPFSMPPLEMGFNGTFNVSTHLAAHLAPGSVWQQACRSTSRPLIYSVQMNIGSMVYDSEVSEIIEEGSGQPMPLVTDVVQANITAVPGDVISYEFQLENTCSNPIVVLWGGQDPVDGGITIQGQMYSPEIVVTVDNARKAHIQLSATIPWGWEDIDAQFTSMEIFGPVPRDEKRAWDEDLRSESFLASSTYLERADEMGRTAKVFTGGATLPSGDNVLTICMKTIDSQDFNECDIDGLVRFEVKADAEPLMSASLWISISGFIAVISYLFYMINQGMMLPGPLMIAMIFMAVLMIPLASDIPDMGGEAIIDDDARAPSFILHTNDNGSISLDDLLDGREAVILAISLPASTNALDQATQLDNAKGILGDRVSVAQIFTGEDVRMSDLDAFEGQMNVSWPLMMDDGDSRFAKRMPLGVADSIVIIDAAGHITYSIKGSASSDELVDAVDAIGDGGQQSAFDTFSLLWGPGLALLLVALPRKGYVKPEEAMPPGTLWASIIAAGGVGFLMVNFIPLILAFSPFDNDMKVYFELGLILWFISAAIRAAFSGTPWEINLVSRGLYNLYSKGYRDWREHQDVERDLLIGFWMGWFVFMAHPALLAQGVAAMTLTGGMNWLMGPLNLILICLIVGLLTLIIRIIATWGGPISRAFGSFGSQPFSEALGWALVPISIWLLIDAVLDAMAMGVF